MRIASIVLAAGRSSRMGPRNKLLEPINGEPMIRRVAATALASGAQPIVVVTGHEAPVVTAALRGLDVTAILNPDYADGLSTSLRAGLGALSSDIDGALTCLATCRRPRWACSLPVAAFTDASAICVPVRHGRRATPCCGAEATSPRCWN